MIHRNAASNLHSARFESGAQGNMKQLELMTANSSQFPAGGAHLLRSATCSPAMGGRKTIMNLPSRLDQH